MLTGVDGRYLALNSSTLTPALLSTDSCCEAKCVRSAWLRYQRAYRKWEEKPAQGGGMHRGDAFAWGSGFHG